MAKDSENRYTLPLIAGCSAIMIIVSVMWGNVIHDLMHDTVFVIGCIVGIAAFICFSIIAEIRKDYPENIWKVLVLVAAAAYIIWDAAWKSDYNVKKSEGINYQYEKPK